VIIVPIEIIFSFGVFGLLKGYLK